MAHLGDGRTSRGVRGDRPETNQAPGIAAGQRPQRRLPREAHVDSTNHGPGSHTGGPALRMSAPHHHTDDAHVRGRMPQPSEINTKPPTAHASRAKTPPWPRPLLVSAQLKGRTPVNDEVHDHRPLSTAAEALSTGKRAVMSWKRRNPKRFAAAATATVVGVLTPGIAALIVGVSGDSDPTEPDENTTGIDDLLVGAWENALRPTIADPLAAWAETHLVAGTDLPGYAPVILWAVLGGPVWLLGLGRAINAKVVWPAFGGATTLAAYAGAAPDREAVTVGACVLLWLLLSLPVYRRRTPRPKPEPRPSWEERRRTEKLRDAEHYKRILDMATPGSEEHGILRHYLDAEGRSLTHDAQRQHAQKWVEIFSAGKRFTASMAMVGAG